MADWQGQKWIVIRELAPRGLALQRPRTLHPGVARPIQLFHAVFKWPITALNAVGKGVLKLCGLEAASGHEMVHSVEELRLLVTGCRTSQSCRLFASLTNASRVTTRTSAAWVRCSPSAPET